MDYYLGQAVGVNVRFDEAVAQTLYDHMSTRRTEFSSMFGKPLDVPESVDVQTRLLALLGRSDDWR